MSDPETFVSDPYAAVAGHLPNDVMLGTAIIAMVEPDPGLEHEWNRWYEDDHFYAGAMNGPWIFAGKRWVATRDLQALRFPIDSPVAQPVTAGCYVSIYFVLAGHYQDVLRWGQVGTPNFLVPYGRYDDRRKSIFTAGCSFAFGVVRDDLPYMLPVHALNHPFKGLVLELYQVEDPATLPGVTRQLEYAFRADLSGSPIGATLGFLPEAYSSGGELPAGVNHTPPGAGQSVAVLSFLHSDPA